MFVENNGVKIWYEIHGQGEPTLIMIPGFQIVHSEAFKRAYVPFLARHMSVVTLDLRGSGKSDKPDIGYDLETWVGDINAVIEKLGLIHFAMAGSSCGALFSILYQAKHPEQVSHLIFMNGYPKMIRDKDFPYGMPKETLDGVIQFWQEQPENMLKGFIDLLCSENYSLRTKELIWDWAHETTPEIWAKGFACSVLSDVDQYLKNLDIPVLIFCGKEDKVVLPGASKYMNQKIPNSVLNIIPEAGHGFIRTFPQVNYQILNFLKPEAKKPPQKKEPDKHAKILWISSPIGLGHVRRDLEIVKLMRKKMPKLRIHWLSIDPVTTFLKENRESIHPLSEELWDESGKFESFTMGYALDATEAYWKLDKLLNNNFMVFTDAVRSDDYDLVVGDESWEIDEYLHYNLSLKNIPYVFITDFIGTTVIDKDKKKQTHVHNVNSSWIEMRNRYPEAADLSIFIGEVDDIPDEPFGEGLPNRREWTKDHFKFCGYILPFNPSDYSNRQAIRTELGYSTSENILLVAIGSTSVGRPLIEKCIKAHEICQVKIPGMRTIILCGPRIDSNLLGKHEKVEFLPYVSDPIKYYLACDLAIIQGGLSTAMELTALNRPFLYFPLNDHFEQLVFVPYRLKRYNAGVRMNFNLTSPGDLAEAVVTNIGKPMNYYPVNTDGADKAASMILELL